MAGEGTGTGAGTGAGGVGVGADGQAGEQASQIAEALSEWTPATAKADEKGEPAKVDEKPKEGDGEKPKEGDQPKEGDKPSEPAAENPEIAALKATVESLKGMLETVIKGKSAPAAAGEKPTSAIKPLSYVATQQEIDKAFESPESLNALLSKVENAAIEKVLTMIPAVIDNSFKVQSSLRTKVTDFYTANKDLAGHKDFVGFVVNDLMGKNPDWKIEKVFEELPKEVRKKLGLKQQATVGGKRPATPQRGSGARQPVESSAEGDQLQKEIADLIS